MSATIRKQDMRARYERAEKLEHGRFGKSVARNTTIYPCWIDNTACFWYSRDLDGGNVEYRLVNAKAKTNVAAFDHQRLAELLGASLGREIAGKDLALAEVEFALSPLQVTFSTFHKRWLFEPGTGTCREFEGRPTGGIPSPAGDKILFRRDFNLWLRDTGTGEERPLTADGGPFYQYADTPTVYGRKEIPSLEALWSPDGKRVFTVVIDTREVKVGPPLVEHVPSDGTVRPRVLNPERRVAFPEDEHVDAYRFVAVDVQTGKAVMADYEPSPVVYPPYAGFFTGHRGWWASDSRRAWFIDVARGGKIGRLVEFDTETGNTKTIIEERSDHCVRFIPIDQICTLLVPLPETEELVWFSMRSGWSHLYLYDLEAKELKHSITEGPWVVRDVLHFDAVRRELWLRTAGRATGRNPYYGDIVRVNIDSGALAEIVSTDDDYVVCNGRNRISYFYPRARGVSPSGDYVVATRSRVDRVPETLLFDRTGKELMTIEIADVSGLPTGWRWPEPLMLKAADGETDIYAVLFKPSDFDPAKSYPVLDCTYGYSAPIGSFTNSLVGMWMYLGPAAYAELGFIVVMVNGRGNDCLRDSAFNEYCDPVMPADRMAPLYCSKIDCVAAIKQLAEERPYMDATRVGVVEFGSIPTALTGMLLYPSFYKVGVSINPWADWRLLASLGMRNGDWPALESFASNLEGKLLLVHGMLDDVLPVTMTFRIIEALQKANSEFDLLLLPSLGHDPDRYTIRRAWNYVVQHLLDEDPLLVSDVQPSAPLCAEDVSSAVRKRR